MSHLHCNRDNVYTKNISPTYLSRYGNDGTSINFSIEIPMEEIWSNRPYVALALSSLLATCVVFWSHRRRDIVNTAVMFSPESMYITLDVRHILAWRGTNVYGDFVKLLAFMNWVHFFFHNNFSLLITDSKLELQKSLQWSYIYLC